MKMKLISIKLACLFVGAAILTGCGGPDKGGPTVPVKGVVTLNGEAVSGVEVVFSPIAGNDNPNPGPYSLATTDASGNFELKTRYGDAGAVVGKHSVSFEFPEADSSDMSALQGELETAKQRAKVKDDENPDGAANRVVEIQAQIDALKAKLASLPKIPADAGREIDVPAGGVTDLKIELGSN